MKRTMLPAVVVFSFLASSASFAVADEYWSETPNFSDDPPCETCGGYVEEQSFVYRLFNFRPWTAQSRAVRSAGAPGLPQGRRYYGGRYFGQFNNRYYGPQYGNF